MNYLEGITEGEIILKNVFLNWIKRYEPFSHIESLTELTDCKFFKYILEGLQNFKFLGNVTTQSKQIPFLLSITKNIIKSIQKYNSSVLKREQIKLNINTLQFCMGSQIQIIKFLTLVLNIFGHSPQNHQLIQKIEDMDSENSLMMKQLLQSAKNMDNSQNNSPRKLFSSSDQKKIFQRMEELQLIIYQLEDMNQKLVEKIQTSNDLQQQFTQEKKNLENNIEKLIQKNKQFEEINDLTANKFQLSLIEEEKAKKKLEMVKKKLEQKIFVLTEQINRLKEQVSRNIYLSIKVQEITEINQQLKNQNQCLREEIKKNEQNSIKLKTNDQQKNKQIIKLKEKISELEIKVQEYELNRQIKIERKEIQNLRFQEYCENNMYRIKDELSFMDNKSMEMNKTQKNFLKSFIIENQSKRQSKEKEESDNRVQNNSIFANLEQNNSLFINQNPFSTNKNPQNPQHNKISTSQFNQTNKNPGTQDEETNILLNVILMQMQTIDEMKKSNQSYLINNNSSFTNTSRLHLFKQKIQKLF